MKKLKTVFICFIAVLFLSLNIPRFFEKDSDFWSIVGGVGLEFGAALVLWLLFDRRDQKSEELKIRNDEEKEKKQRHKVLGYISNKLYFEMYLPTTVNQMYSHETEGFS